MYYHKEFVHQVDLKKDCHYIRMHGQQNIKMSLFSICSFFVHFSALNIMIQRVSLSTNLFKGYQLIVPVSVN